MTVAQKGPGSPGVQRKSTLDLAEDTIKEKRRRNLLRVRNTLCFIYTSIVLSSEATLLTLMSVRLYVCLSVCYV